MTRRAIRLRARRTLLRLGDDLSGLGAKITAVRSTPEHLTAANVRQLAEIAALLARELNGLAGEIEGLDGKTS